MDFPYLSPELGSLEPIRKMNKSGKNEVYLVINRENNQRYVLRKMQESGTVYRQLMEIENEHLPKVYEVVEQEGYTIAVEDYVYGDGLDFLLSGGPLTADECRPIMAGLCDVLSVLHQHGIVHRDIKPENIIIHGNVPVLVDFDASRIHRDSEDSDTVVLGTTGFAAPEQYGISQTDHRTDLYAMGVLLNYMLIGKHPSTALAPGGAGRIVRKCTMMNQNQRFQSAEQLKAGLRNLGRPGRIRIGIGLVAVMALVVAGAGMLWPQGNDSQPEQPTLEASQQEDTEISEVPDASEVSRPLEVVVGPLEETVLRDVDAASPARETAQQLGVAPEEVMGYYYEVPENLDARINDFHFVVTQDSTTLYFVYPEDFNGDMVVDVQCFTGEEGSVISPTSENVLDAVTFGAPMETGLPGFSCVPITLDPNYEGSGNLHMNVCMASGAVNGGNVFIYSQDAAMQETHSQDSSVSQERMAYYGEFPTEESEPLNGVFLSTESNRTVWLLYSELWQGQPCQGMEIYQSESEGPPAPSDPELVEHITIGEPEPSGIAGCVCVPITVDEGFSGTGNLHLNLNFGSSGLIGGNVFIAQE